MLNSSAQSTVIPRTVLVVEDEPTLATAIAQRITAEGWTARVASDGASAVQAASTLRPDLVIMDIMLPVMDGLEATKRIVAERPVPVLILTARDDEADKVIGLGARHLFVQANQQTAQHADEKRVRQKAKRAVRELGRSDAQRVRNLGP